MVEALAMNRPTEIAARAVGPQLGPIHEALVSTSVTPGADLGRDDVHVR